jgi:putative RecB family exonuclease
MSVAASSIPLADPVLAPVPLAVPRTLTPSKISAFTSCPLAFRFSVIERRPEPPSLPAVRGTLVHRALQLLFLYSDGGERDRPTAQAWLEEAFAELSQPGGELAELALEDKERAELLAQAGVLLDHYYEIEDPNSVRPAGVELDLELNIDGLQLRGIIDRLDVLPSGGFAVVDYKTGRAPRPEQSRSKLSGVHLYALLCEEILGQRPEAVRLLYLKDRVVISAEASDMSLRGVRQRAGAVWKAIVRACERSDFRPNPSVLCGWCSFRQHCPAFGGDPDSPL